MTNVRTSHTRPWNSRGAKVVSAGGFPVGLELGTERCGEDLAQRPIPARPWHEEVGLGVVEQNRKSTRLNSSHANISYAVFCLKKKKKMNSKDIVNKKKNKSIRSYDYRRFR